MLLNRVEYVLMNNPVRAWIQRAYEAGQSLMKSDDERQRQAIRVMGSGA